MQIGSDEAMIGVGPCLDVNCSHDNYAHDGRGNCKGKVVCESSGGTWYERPCGCSGYKPSYPGVTTRGGIPKCPSCIGDHIVLEHTVSTRTQHEIIGLDTEEGKELSLREQPLGRERNRRRYLCQSCGRHWPVPRGTQLVFW